MHDWRPYSVNVEITLACDLRCSHCGSSAGRARPDELTFDELKTCFHDLATLDCQEVCLLGGEPLVRKDWQALCDEVGAAGLDLLVITNGMRVDADTVEILANMKHLQRVGVSLDAAAPEIHDSIRGREGSHAKALAALWALRDAGLEVGAITTVSNANLGQLGPLRDLLVEQDITWQIQVASVGGERFSSGERLSRLDFLNVGKFISTCRQNFSVDELPVAGSHDLGYNCSALGSTGELPKWHGCGAGLYTLGIMSDGRVKGCLSQHDDFVEDSIRRRSLVEIWRDPTLFARNRQFSPQQLEGFCQTCKFGEECRAGCSNIAYTSTGSSFNNPYCFYRIQEAEE